MKRELTEYQKQALDYSSNILLTANAGSGKTFVLSKRFVEILLNGDIELENIVAITFTDKAAGELNKRIVNEIDKRILFETDYAKKRKLETTRRQLVSANISTIHSFCITILKEFAPEAGIDAGFVPIDQFTSDELIDLSVDEAVNNLIADKEKCENLKYLIRLFGSKQIVINHIADAIQHRKTIEQHIKDLYAPAENEIAENFRKQFEELFEILFDKKIGEAVKSIAEINRHVLGQPKGNEIAGEVAKYIVQLQNDKSVFELMKTLGQIDELVFTKTDKAIKSRAYLSKNRDDFEEQIESAENVFSELRPFFEIIEPETAALESAHFGKIFLEVFEHAAKIYSGKKNQKGYLDFEDILLYTKEIIKLEEVRLYLRNKFKYIMIDEYQDTNELQYKIFMPVLDDLRQGNLFVVGDEKQSIYMFRDADLRVFNKTKDDILHSGGGGKHLKLPHSFRMAPQLVLFTNKLFKKLFADPELMLNEVAYDELVCAKQENEKARVEFLLADKGKEITEAQLTASKILELISSGDVKLDEIGILCRKRNLFSEIEEEFVKNNIPYSIVGGKGFYQRQTIYDVYNYLSFILDKDDDAALVGILRSPFYNLSDAFLFEISLEEGNTFYNKLKKRAAGSLDLKKIIAQLEGHSKLGYNAEIFTLIRTILIETNYWAVVASKKNANQEIANLEKLLILARTFSQKSFKNLYDFKTFLKESIEMMEDESQAQVSQNDNTVKLLTIHQAKGLEYKAVFLFGCNGYAREDAVRTKGLSIDKDFGLLTKVPANKNYFAEYSSPPTTVLYNYINHKKNTAEIKRLLYVAVTRAINYLFITAEHKEYKTQRDSFFELFSEGLNLDFEKDEILLGGNITFMKGSEDNYSTYEKYVDIGIKIVKEVAETQPLKIESTDDKKEIKFLTEKINDIPKREIISATKISIFTQCPVKYELTYDLGYSRIYDMVKRQQNNFEFNSKEDEESNSFADTKGRIIHNILKEEFDKNNLESMIDSFIKGESLTADSEQTEKIKTGILNELISFSSSEVYKALKTYSNYKNELEVYCEENGHYLFGIIDKLIYDSGKLIIIDYKTDDVEADQIKYRTENYFPQLKFYAYILTKLYPDYSNYALRLIFVKRPEEIVLQEFGREELQKYGGEINNSIEKIIRRQYKSNLNHCSKCHFALDGRCILNFEERSDEKSQ
jgi:ATP-dependent helicase/nuclease subunit A